MVHSQGGWWAKGAHHCCRGFLVVVWMMVYQVEKPKNVLPLLHAAAKGGIKRWMDAIQKNVFTITTAVTRAACWEP